MKPDCDNEKCWNNDVEYEGACSIHIHKSCDDYIHKTQEIKDIENKSRLESLKIASRHLNDISNSSSNADKIRRIKEALDKCHKDIEGNDEIDINYSEEVREIVANRSLRRFLENLFKEE